jgi:AraC-like DNA-binding protein
MLNQEHLTLRLTRLRATEAWSVPADLAFLFPKGGTANCMCGRLTQCLAPGDVALLGGKEPWQVSVAERGQLVFWDFTLKLEHLFPLFGCEEIALLQAVVERLKGIRLYPAASALAQECHRLIGELPPQFNLDHRSQLLRVAATILNEEFKDARPQRSGFVRIEEHLVQAFEKLSTEELLSLSVGELAERFGCSRRHLNRLFHQHFGLSVVGLRMEMRLLKAVSLLRDPDAKIIHVAEQSGFNHLGLFNMCFRKRFGTSPGQWRKLGAAAGGAAASLVGAGTFCPMRSNGFCPWLEGGHNGARAASGQEGPGDGPPPLARTNGRAAEATLGMTRACKTSECCPLMGPSGKGYCRLEVASAGEAAVPPRCGQSSQP